MNWAVLEIKQILLLNTSMFFLDSALLNLWFLFTVSEQRSLPGCLDKDRTSNPIHNLS